MPSCDRMLGWVRDSMSVEKDCRGIVKAGERRKIEDEKDISS